MHLVERIHAYLLHDAQGWFDVAVPIPPFVWFRRQGSSTEQVNVAMPAVPIDRHVGDALSTLHRATAEYGWTPRIEFPEWYAPRLPAVLESAGFMVGDRRALLVCRPDTLQAVPDVPGLELVTLTHESNLRAIRESLDANALGFDPSASPTTDEYAEKFRLQLFAARAFTAHLAGETAGAGMFTAPHDGLTQLVGIATLAPYRRRGIAAALTHFMTCTAFELGVDLAFLTAANETAGRVYERVGYVPCGALVTYVEPLPTVKNQ